MSAEDSSKLSPWESVKVLFGASRAFWLVNQVNFLDGIAYFGILNLLTLFISQYVGVSEQFTGGLVSSFTGAVTLFMLGGGFISDKLGVRKAISLCLILLLAGRLLLLFSGVGGFWLLVLSLTLMAAGTGILQPALYAGVKAFTDKRTATIGYSLLYAIMNLGILIESLLSPLLRKQDTAVWKALGQPAVLAPKTDLSNEAARGIPVVFLLLAAVTVVMLGIHLFLFTRKVEVTDQLAHAEPEASEAADSAAKPKLSRLSFPFLFFIFILLPVRTLFAHQFLTMPDYITRCFPEHIGAHVEWFQGLNPFIIVIFVPLIGALTQRVSILKMMIIGTTLSAVTTFILVPGPQLNLLILYIVLFSLGEAVWSSRFMEFVADLAPAGQVGAYMGFANIPWFLAKATTGWYSGPMIAALLPGPDGQGADHSGTMWLIYGLIACISPIGLVLGRRFFRFEAAAEAKPAAS